MENGDLSLKELSDKREDYKEFIERTLQPQLKVVLSQREEIESEIEEYRSLRSSLAALRTQRQRRDDEKCGGTEKNKNELESLVDLGHGAAYCRAVVPDPSTVFVHVGMGFHVEFSLDEAVGFIDRRVSHLTEGVLADRVEKVATVGCHLRDALDIMETLDREFEAMDL